jgi:hypothetical protein
MRKVVAGALAAAALSWAYGARADAAKERREAADATKSEARQAGKDARQSADRATDPMRSDAQAGRTSSDEKKHPLFEGKNNFDVKGKVSQVSQDSITIQRDELPPATLHVSQNTKVEMDGKQVSTHQLQRGQDVKASFNLRGDKAEAVEIKADKPKADDRKEMGEQSRENREDAQKRQQKQQQQR